MASQGKGKEGHGWKPQKEEKEQMDTQSTQTHLLRLFCTHTQTINK